MRIGVVIVNFNSSKLVNNLVNDIKDFASVEKIVIVDNASKDEDYEILKSIKSDKIVILKNETNLGYGYGNNVGVKYIIANTSIDKVIIANPDIRFLSENGIVKMYDFLEENKDYSIVTLKADSVDQNRYKKNLNAWRLPTFWNDLLKFGLIYNHFYNPKYQIKDFIDFDKLDVEVVEGCMFMINVEDFDSIGMYDERMFLYGEEALLGYKLKVLNKKSCLLLDESFQHNHVYSTTNTQIKSIFKKRSILFNSKKIVWNYYNIGILKKMISNIYYALSNLEYLIYVLIKKVFRIR